MYVDNMMMVRECICMLFHVCVCVFVYVCACVCIHVVIVYVCEQCCQMDCECIVCFVHVSTPITMNKVVDVILCLDTFCHTIIDFVIECVRVCLVWCVFAKLCDSDRVCMYVV